MRTGLDALDVRKLNVVALSGRLAAVWETKQPVAQLFHFAALGGTELSSRADSEGVKPGCAALNPPLSWPAL